MAWGRRGHADRIVWEDPGPQVRVALGVPAHRGGASWVRRRAEVDGRTVLAAVPPVLLASGSLQAPAGVPPSLLVTPLASSLPSLLVTDDFFQPATEFTDAPRLDLAVPPEDDPYDGRRWRVHSHRRDFAIALLDADLWAWLVDQAKAPEPVRLAVVRDRVVCRSDGRRRDATARRVVGFAERVDAAIAEGRLDPWVGLAEDMEPLVPRERVLPGSDWPVVPPDRNLLFALWDVWPSANVFGMVRAEVDGHEVLVLQTAEVRGGCLVVVGLDHRVADHVVLTSGRFARGNVDAEWLDFDDTYTVRANDQRVGHEVTTPLLMQFLFDHRVHRIDVHDRWLIARAKRFHHTDVEQVARVLLQARGLLPRRDVGR